MGPVLIQVLTADSGRDDVDGADVAQRPLRLAQCLFRRIVGRGFRAPDQLDNFHDSHFDPPSSSSTLSLALTPSISAARCHWSTGAGASPAALPSSASNRAIAAA